MGLAGGFPGEQVVDQFGHTANLAYPVEELVIGGAQLSRYPELSLTLFKNLFEEFQVL